LYQGKKDTNTLLIQKSKSQYFLKKRI